MVQTNVVRRCASVLPAFAHVDELGLGGALYLIEIWSQRRVKSNVGQIRIRLRSRVSLW